MKKFFKRHPFRRTGRFDACGLRRFWRVVCAGFLCRPGTCTGLVCGSVERSSGS